MNKAIILLILGVAIIIFPQYVRHWRIDEVGENPPGISLLLKELQEYYL